MIVQQITGADARSRAAQLSRSHREEMKLEQISFRRADSTELETVLSYLKEAALWLSEKGIDYWQNWLDPPPNFVNWIQRGFDESQFYIVQKDEKDIGCFRLQRHDLIHWGEQEDNADYIHSFTISRDLVGQGIGAQVLELIESYCHINNKDLLRLDCGANVEGLFKYYEDHGFRPVGEVTVSGYNAILYEKHIDSKNGEQCNCI